MTIVGIDLGTTYSAVGFVNDLDKPQTILNRDGEPTTPSVVLFQDDAPLVGTMAKRSAATAPLDVVQFVKRQMGDPAYRFEASNGGQYRAEEVSAFILRRLKEDAEEFLGRPVTQAVVTVPAYFDTARRKATQDAGMIAGLEVVRVLNEPTAAALAYGIGADTASTFLVYDLGGGTFDVTVMRADDGELRVMAIEGDRNLGGFDFDNVLMKLINDRVMGDGGADLFNDEQATAMLRERAELAKHSLTTVERARVVLTAGGRNHNVVVTRAEFEEAAQGLLNRTRGLTEIALDDAGLTWAGIDKVLLVGGSTRMPMVRRMVEAEAGKPVERGINPDELVVLGAAVQARLEEASRQPGAVAPVIDGRTIPPVAEATSHGLGTLARNPVTGRMENTVIIPRNSRIPAQRQEFFSTVVDNQEQVAVEITQGDDIDPEGVQILDTKVVKLPSYAAGAPIAVTYAYDIDQTVFVEVTDLTAQRSLGTFEIYAPQNFSEQELTDSARRLTNVGVQ
ncbi:Hsp70 family protein [Dactylosporangium sp. AC04546]|uniref:Hsp70 family protein n=1 Tax=Dactylosporangium sp. AC04546 TaxID=2862460 RepID=UPI001EDEDDD3|nr:Hsp70 family protein [Dactylosporangium sp. AC04546]WVK84244.1 Hsp70 family protein [Dactylosporangium sp. AC04546]